MSISRHSRWKRMLFACLDFYPTTFIPSIFFYIMDFSQSMSKHQFVKRWRECVELTCSLAAASSTPTSSLTWITWFCSLPGHEYFAEVSEEFIEDDFNLTGLNSLVPFWKEAMEMVLDVEPGARRDTLDYLSGVLIFWGAQRIHSRFQTCLLSRLRRNCCTVSCTSVTF